MTKLGMIAATLLLAACGVDGAPIRPEPEAAAKPGVSVSGEARLGVVTAL